MGGGAKRPSRRTIFIGVAMLNPSLKYLGMKEIERKLRGIENEIVHVEIYPEMLQGRAERSKEGRNG